MELVELIQNLGFPIAVVVYLFYQQHEDAKRHAEESKGFIDAINNNTLVMSKLSDKLDSLEEEIKENE